METLDTIIVTIIVLSAVFYILNKLKSAVFSKKSDGCSGCNGADGCSTTQKTGCDSNIEGQVFK